MKYWQYTQLQAVYDITTTPSICKSSTYTYAYIYTCICRYILLFFPQNAYSAYKCCCQSCRASSSKSQPRNLNGNVAKLSKVLARQLLQHKSTRESRQYKGTNSSTIKHLRNITVHPCNLTFPCKEIPSINVPL